MAEDAAPKYTAEQLEQGIANALHAHNVEAAVDILKVLIAVDPRRGEIAYDTIKLGLAIAAERRDRVAVGGQYQEEAPK